MCRPSPVLGATRGRSTRTSMRHMRPRLNKRL
jgi:hypothetical protein